MSKLNKIWRILIGVGILFAIIASVVIIVELNNIPKQYEEYRQTKIEKVNEEIVNVLYDQEYDDMAEIIKAYSVEITIKNMEDNKVVFSSIDDMSVNSNAVSYEIRYTENVNGVEYEIWWLMYNVLPQDVFEDNIKKITVAVVIIIMWITFLLAILFVKFLLPLRDLRNNINKLSEFKLDEIKTTDKFNEYGDLNREIADFGHDLDVFMKVTSYKYTDLESQLQYQNEKLLYQNRLVASLTHNLKAPLVTIKYLLLDEVINPTTITGKIDDTINEINDISRIVFDNSNVNLDKEEFDLIDTLFNIYESYQIVCKEKNLYVEFDVDEKLIICDYKLYYKQLIHNAFSNIVSYAKDNADVEIMCYLENNKLILSFYNEATQLSEDQLANVFKLFYRISDSKEGLGTGLFTIKTISNRLDGKIYFENAKSGVVLRFEKEI